MRWTQYMLSLFEERRTQRFYEWVMRIWSIMKTTIMRNRMCQTQSPVLHLTNACMEGNVQRLLKQGFWRRRKNFNTMRKKLWEKAYVSNSKSSSPSNTFFNCALVQLRQCAVVGSIRGQHILWVYRQHQTVAISNLTILITQHPHLLNYKCCPNPVLLLIARSVFLHALLF